MIVSCKIGLTYGYSFPVIAVGWGGGGVKHPWGVLPVVTYTGRLLPTGVPFSGFRYIKGCAFYLLKNMKGWGNLSFWSVRPNRAKRCISWPWNSRENVLVLWFIQILKTAPLEQFKGGGKFQTSWFGEGVPFVNKRYTKGVRKWCMKC